MTTTRRGTLKLYADTPGRRTAQVVADVLFVLWLVLWVWVAIVFWVLPEMCSSGYDCSTLMERKLAD